MYKVKFIFELNNGEKITNDKKYDEEYIDQAKTDEELEDRIGCVVYFDSIPMLQDYQEYVNKMWCGCLQFIFGMGFSGDKHLKIVTTELLNN